MKKEPKCTFCGGAHYKINCFTAPKTAIKTKTPIITSKPTKPLKRAYIQPRSRTNTRKKLTYELDRIFSIYIRRKDAVNGFAKCVTCPARMPYKLMQNGHFISRKRIATRWDVRNCHVQCKHCNETLDGNLKVYKAFMLQKYGPDVLYDLKQLANSGDKITTIRLSEMITMYKHLVDNLE